MSNVTIAVRKPGKLTLQSLRDEMLRLRELNAAIARNGKKKLAAWDSARRLLDLGD